MKIILVVKLLDTKLFSVYIRTIFAEFIPKKFTMTITYMFKTIKVKFTNYQL